MTKQFFFLVSFLGILLSIILGVLSTNLLMFWVMMELNMLCF